MHLGVLTEASCPVDDFERLIALQGFRDIFAETRLLALHRSQSRALCSPVLWLSVHPSHSRIGVDLRTCLCRAFYAFIQHIIEADPSQSCLTLFAL